MTSWEQPDMVLLNGFDMEPSFGGQYTMAPLLLLLQLGGVPLQPDSGNEGIKALIDDTERS